MKVFANWLKINKLSLNLNKTYFIIFHNRQTIESETNIEINDIKIEQVTCTTFLGILINKNLAWNDCIEIFLKKLVKTWCHP